MRKNKFIKLTALIMALITALLAFSACSKTPSLDDQTDEQTEAITDNSAGSVNAVPLDKFVIVHEDNDLLSSFAMQLKTAIKTATGYDLSTVADAEGVAEAEYEIIIGNVDRDVTKEFYENPYKYYNIFKILVSGKKVALLGKNDYTLKGALDAFIDEFFAEGAAPARITDDTALSGDIYNTKNAAINRRVNDTDIRIAANNIFFHQWSEDAMYEVRKPYLLQNFVLFDADVLMLQECGYDKSISPTKNTWHDVIDHELEDLGYTYVPANPKTKLYENYTPIWYNAEKLELVDCKYFLYSSVKELPDASISHSKSYTMAVFKDKNTQNQFACISTHFTWASTAEQATRLKRMDANEAVAEVKALREKYGEDFPIILMGDLNSSTSDEPYRILAKELKNARLTSGIAKNNISYGTTHGLGSLPASGGGIIDHTLFSGSAGGFKPVQYQHVINQWSSHSTDHIPLLFDIAFN